jgi:hypothetical protein
MDEKEREREERKETLFSVFWLSVDLLRRW